MNLNRLLGLSRPPHGFAHARLGGGAILRASRVFAALLLITVTGMLQAAAPLVDTESRIRALSQTDLEQRLLTVNSTNLPR